MNPGITTELNKDKVKVQQRLVEIIQHKSKEVYNMEKGYPKVVEEEILDFLIMLQSYQAKEL